MNTKPTKKRRSFAAAWIEQPPGEMTGTILNSTHAIALANLVVAFEHCEAQMYGVLGRLLNVPPHIAGYVLRSIGTHYGRATLMEQLLQKAPQNAHRSEAFDEIISEFKSIGSARNKYVHGRWWTNRDTGDTYLAEHEDELPQFFAPRVVKDGEIDACTSRIHALMARVIFNPPE